MKSHLRVTILGHCASPRQVFIQCRIVRLHLNVLKLADQLVLLQGVQAAVEAVLLARQRFPVFGCHAVIIHLSVSVGHSVYVHVDYEAEARRASLSKGRGQSVAEREARWVFVFTVGGALAGDFHLTYLRKSKGKSH